MTDTMPVTSGQGTGGFTRKATGLVREVSGTDALIMNMIGMNLGVGAVFLFLQAPALFPRGSMLLAVVIGTLLMAFTLLWVYAEFAAAMPRSLGLVTRAGEDAPAEALAEAGAVGVALDGVVRVSGPTVRCWVLYEPDGRRAFVSRTPPERYDEVALRVEDVPEAWASAPAFVIAAMRLDAAEALVARVRALAPDAAIVLDTHEDHVGDAARVLRLAAQVAAFCPSRDELAELAGFDAPERSAPALAAATGTPLVAKLGASGCLVALPDGAVWRIASAAREVVDPTGAGDAFCGGVAAALAAGDDVVEAARRGSASAALALAGQGSGRFRAAAEAGAPALPEAEPLAPPAAGDTPRSPRAAGDPPASPGAAADPSPRAPGALPTSSPARGDGRAIGVMAGEIETVPRVISDQLALLEQALDALADELVGRAVEHVVLTGCGDSAFAGQATALGFARHAGVGVRAIHALDLARYELRYLPPNSAVVCVSYSGMVGRTIEAAIQARRFGHLAIALTGAPDTPLAAECERVLTLTVPTRGLSPGTSTYVAMVTALADLALRWAAARGEDVAAAVAALDGVPELARATLAAADAPARALGRRLAGQPWVCLAGAGPNEASARFGAAKLLEGAQVLGTATNVEEWAHEEYFLTRRGTPVIVVAPAGSADDRVADVLEELVAAGADAVLVSDSPAPGGVAHLPLAAGLPEELTPLLAALPLSVVAFALAEASGKRSYNFASAEAERRHYETIHAVRPGVPA